VPSDKDKHAAKLRKLRKALEFARLDFNEVCRMARAGEAQFHEVGASVGITHIGVSGPFRTCYCLAVAGEYADLPALERTIEKFARENGCQAIETTGRRGWERVHAKLADGYAISAVKFRKILEPDG
jgi:hypothetical protein